METTLLISALLIIACTLIPLVRHDYWTFRVFDYPRLQKLMLSLIWLGLFAFVIPPSESWHWAMPIAMLANVAYLAYQILPFTPVGRKQVLKAVKHDEKNSLSIFIANVYEDNKDTVGCIRVIHSCDPDIVLLVETNKRWTRETAILDVTYPHHVKVPLENTYGMLLFSKLPLQDMQVAYLVEPDIPSIHGTVQLPSGQLVQLHAVHPTPPVPNENPRSTERDSELLLVAKRSKASDLPVIVIGDLNDVAWSYTTELFLKVSELLDPRRGRGFFNTFHAGYPLVRFPLDHAFISSHFKLKALKRTHNFGSDHFPILVNLQYEPLAANEQESSKLDATKSDEAEAEEKIEAASG